MACRVIERASSACGEVARAAAGTIEYSINNCDGYRPSVTVRAVQDTPADLERTLFGRSDLKRSRKRRRVCPENPPQSVHRELPLGPELDSVAQTAVANSQRNENVPRELPRLIQRVLQSLPDSPAVGHCVARERGGGPRTLPVAHSRAAPASPSPRSAHPASVVRPHAQTGASSRAGNSSIRRVRAREGFRCVPRGSRHRGHREKTRRRRSRGVRALNRRAHSSRGEDPLL